MNRRDAFQNIIFLTSGAILFPSCQLKPVTNYENLNIKEDDFNSIQKLIDE